MNKKSEALIEHKKVKTFCPTSGKLFAYYYYSLKHIFVFAVSEK